MGLLRPCLALQNNPFLGQVYLFHFKPHNSFYLQGNLCHILLWPQILPTMTFKPHFWTITILSLIFITFRVSHFPVSHLTYKTVKLGLQNTLNMSKTTRVYFGVLQMIVLGIPNLLKIFFCKNPTTILASFLEQAAASTNFVT